MIVTPFTAVRPTSALAPVISVPPYDVVTLDEVKLEAKNLKSFFRVTRAEIALPAGMNLYDQAVYDEGAQALKEFLEKGWLVQDKAPSLYVYQEIFQERVQSGLVALVSTEEYKNNVIKKHELTRKDKELDRINHIFTCRAHTEPVFLTIKSDFQLKELFKKSMITENLRLDFVSADKVTHKLWQIDKSENIKEIQALFKEIPVSYIADGHHRAAASCEVSARLGNSSFMAVIFPHDELLVLPYHRLVRDHKKLGWGKIRLLAEKYFDFSKGKVNRKHEFGIFVDGDWLKMTAKKSICVDSDPIKTLDVYILQEFFLKEIFGIVDPRVDKNIDFIGGSNLGAGGQEGIERYCQKNHGTIGISMHATTVSEMMAVADRGLIMPPKSTWFEPKLRSGLFLNLIR